MGFRRRRWRQSEQPNSPLQDVCWRDLKDRRGRRNRCSRSGGFGAVTITKAITLDGGGGIVASVLVSGTNGINVVAGATDIVLLRSLSINGLGCGITRSISQAEKVSSSSIAT
jgi:hypothetical protein